MHSNQYISQISGHKVDFEHYPHYQPWGTNPVLKSVTRFTAPKTAGDKM